MRPRFAEYTWSWPNGHHVTGQLSGNLLIIFSIFRSPYVMGYPLRRGFLCETYPKSDAFLRIAFSIDQWKGGIVNDLLSNVNDILYNVGMLKAKLDVLGWFRKPISIKISKIRR